MLAGAGVWYCVECYCYWSQENRTLMMPGLGHVYKIREELYFSSTPLSSEAWLNEDTFCGVSGTPQLLYGTILLFGILFIYFIILVGANNLQRNVVTEQIFTNFTKCFTKTTSPLSRSLLIEGFYYHVYI